MEKRTVRLSLINKLVFGGMILLFAVMIGLEFGLLGFVLTAITILFLGGLSYRKIEYSRESIILVTSFRRQIILLREVTSMSYNNEFRLINGKTLLIPHQLMYNSTQLSEMLDLVRSVLGKQTAYITTQNKKYDALRGLGPKKSWQDFQHEMRVWVSEYDQVPVEYSPDATVISSLPTHS